MSKFFRVFLFFGLLEVSYYYCYILLLFFLTLIHCGFRVYRDVMDFRSYLFALISLRSNYEFQINFTPACIQCDPSHAAIEGTNFCTSARKV